MIKIELTDKDAKLFAEFRRHQDQYKRLLENGVFDYANGKWNIHKDGVNFQRIEFTKTIRYSK